MWNVTPVHSTKWMEYGIQFLILTLCLCFRWSKICPAAARSSLVLDRKHCSTVVFLIPENIANDSLCLSDQNWIFRIFHHASPATQRKLGRSVRKNSQEYREWRADFFRAAETNAPAQVRSAIFSHTRCSVVANTYEKCGLALYESTTITIRVFGAAKWRWVAQFVSRSVTECLGSTWRYAHWLATSS